MVPTHFTKCLSPGSDLSASSPVAGSTVPLTHDDGKEGALPVPGLRLPLLSRSTRLHHPLLAQLVVF
jgi:hypothetical protein